ncbi:Bax inhibitor-1 family protein [Bacillus badius]|uniref:Membrane protein n=1 Tax=Bacillus badius TaxID=1455 RepID=A0ABR5AV41_BACBA|nr:Bax inhibitor-1/YccA family protein [Bacillus badius]KIL76496.1 membrane protein [Bacillus badius]KIL78613.1 membrane protein [Bacillus badius]MED4716030.1 Bax inhibitor-1/YccA family protein [Bacillus badius]
MSSYTIPETSNPNHLNAVLRAFALSLGVGVIGMSVGTVVPPALFLPLAILEILLLVGAFFLRRRKAVGYTFLYAFSFLSGVTTYPIVSYYLMTSGAQVVLGALASTFVVFFAMAVVGTKTKKDLSFLSGLLLTVLLALITLSIMNFFWPFSSTAMLVYSIIGTVLFSMYVMYDFNQMKRMTITSEMVPLLALNLYLDFVNLFINLLRVIGILSDD